MKSCPEVMAWGFRVIFEKKQELRSEAGRSELRSEPRRVQLGLGGAPRVVGSDGTVSIVKIMLLSPRVEKPKSQEGNKSFVPELKKVVSVSSVF